MKAVRNREREVDAARLQHERLIKEVDERIQWVLAGVNVKEMIVEGLWNTT